MENLDVFELPTPEESDGYFRNLPPRPQVRSTLMAVTSRSGDQGGDDDIAKVGKNFPSVIAFGDGLSAENRDAVMLGVEFAETVATSKHDIDKDPIAWLRSYAEAMKHAGWLTVGGHEYGSYSTKDTSITMDAIVLELISLVAGPNAATVASLMGLVLDKLQKNDPLMKLFERNSKRGTLARFRIMPCIESKEGIPVTYLLSMHCDYSRSSGGALFWKWSSSQLDIKRLAKGVQFNKSSFERNRQLILDHLQGESEDFFAGLKK